MAEGCDCRKLGRVCKHEGAQSFNELYDSSFRRFDFKDGIGRDTAPQISVEIISKLAVEKEKECEANTAKCEDDKSSNLSKVNSRSCPDLTDIKTKPGQSVRPRSVTFGRLTKKLGRRKSWKICRKSSQEDSSDGEDKKQCLRKRNGKERKIRMKRAVEENKDERQTSTSAFCRVRRRAETESKGTKSRKARAQWVSMFDKFKRLFDSDSTERCATTNTSNTNQTNTNSVSISTEVRSNAPTQTLMPSPSALFDPPRPVATAGPEHLAFIDKLVREENLHFFDEETQRLWRERTTMECFLPPDILSVTNCPYYWGPINRYQAEKELEDYPDGMYLLRDSAQYHYLYSVSFRRYKRTYHARIEQWRHRYSFDKPSEYSFYSKSVCDLLQHYSKAEHCMFYEPMLIKPLARKVVLPLQAICRAAICSKTTFSGVEKLPLPRSQKNYLREYHYKVPVKKMADKGTQTQQMPKNWKGFGASWWT